MRKTIAWLSFLVILVSLTGCRKEEEKKVPELLEPVGVQLDTETVHPGTVQKISAYSGEVIPYVEELSFRIDGTLHEIYVLPGDYVTEGQLLAELSEESALNQIETLKTRIAEIRKTGDFSDRQAKADISIAKTELAQLKANGASELDRQLKALEIEQLELALQHSHQLRQLELDENQRKLDNLQATIGQGQITAPFTGRIISVKDLSEGDSLRGYTTVICIADETRLSLVTEFMSQATISNAAKVFAKIGSKEYPVEYIPYDPVEYATLVLAGETVPAKFSIQAPPGAIQSGEFAMVMVYTVCKEDVLAVPINALFRESGSWYVYKIVGDTRVRCDVTVGAVSSVNAEILEGLVEGDVVYVKN